MQPLKRQIFGPQNYVSSFPALDSGGMSSVPPTIVMSDRKANEIAGDISKDIANGISEDIANDKIS